MLKLRRAALAASLMVLAACTSMDGSSRAVSGPPQIAPWGFDLAGMDTTVRPGDDFFRYAGGTWMKSSTIPADRTRWGSFDKLREQSDKDVAGVVAANDAESHDPGSVGQKVADFNKAFLDTSAIEAKGLAPARADLDAIAGVQTHEDIAVLMARPGLPVGGPFAAGTSPDQKDPNRYVMLVSQSGLGLPDRDYYLKAEKKFRDIRAAYVGYIAQMLRLAGYPDPDNSAKAIMRLETEMAKVSWERAKRRNRDLTYNFNTHDQLLAYAPDFPWDVYLDTLGIAGFDRFVLRENDAVQNETRIFRKTPVETWKAYMTFHYLNTTAPVLPKAFDDADFAFARIISGQQSQRERWKRSVAALGNSLGEAVGELYVARHFPPAAKEQMLDLVENVRAAYRARIEGLAWMGPETKQQALAKLAAFRVKIAYPDTWRDYSAYEVKGDDALGNAKRADVFEWQRDAARINSPVDKDEWRMTPQTVNAYYNPTFNEIVFPAAILQPPFFDPNADPAVNYGAIGAVIGHEMGHGFDDQGAKSDAAGILRNWWTKEDGDRFRDRVKALGSQYSTFEPLPGLKVNGDLTMGENIGDLGGISVAYEAYRASLDGKEPPVLDGFTGEQRFFLAYAQVWRSLIRDEALQNQVMTDSHSPAQYRTNGVVRNVDAWYDAFGVGPDAKLYVPPEKRVHIW